MHSKIKCKFICIQRLNSVCPWPREAKMNAELFSDPQTLHSNQDTSITFPQWRAAGLGLAEIYYLKL